MWLAKAWTAIDRLSIIWKSNLPDKIKRNFFQASVVSFKYIFLKSERSLICYSAKKLPIFLLPHIRQGLTQVQWPEGRLKWGLGEGWVWAEARTLLVCDAHRPAECNVSLMSQACPKESTMQLTHSKVAQMKAGALRLQVCHWFFFGASLWNKETQPNVKSKQG